MVDQLSLRTVGPDDTRRLAGAVADALEPGDIVALTGELGAGKTCFVQGAAAALGVRGRVTSPSFVLRRDYTGDVPVVHLDIYRLDDLGEVHDLGFDEATDGRRVTFVEWADAMSPLLPIDYLEVELTVTEETDADDRRRVALHAHGDDWRRRLSKLTGDLRPWIEGG